MNSNERLGLYLYERPQDYREDPRVLWAHPLSASTLALDGLLEWPAPALAWSEPQMPFADPPARY